MDEDFFERAEKFFPKAKDWPPPERRKTITPEEMVAPKKKKLKADDVKK
jgi:hypothetical protein